jgi:nucleotide-binding universal stress UspA family protein
MPFDHVIVGVDGSDYGYEALRQALVLRAPNGTLEAITVLDAGATARAGLEQPRLLALLVDEAERAREHAVALLEGYPSCEARLVHGNVLETLLEQVQRERATLVAVGTQRHSRTVGILLGATSTGLLHDAPCPVLLARPRWGELWSPQRILVGVDGSGQSLAALETADELAARLGSAVTVLAATGGKQIEPEGAWSSRVDKWAPGHPVVALLDQSIHADLVIVGSRGLHGLSSLGSVSERVAHRAPCSVLVVRSLERAGETADETVSASHGRDIE